jgi:hypothetical protein
MKIKERMKKKSRNLERKGVAVNPFLTIMYRGMSFRTWMKITKMYKKRRIFEKRNELRREDSVEIIEKDEKDEQEPTVYTFETERYDQIPEFEAKKVGFKEFKMHEDLQQRKLDDIYKEMKKSFVMKYSSRDPNKPIEPEPMVSTLRLFTSNPGFHTQELEAVFDEEEEDMNKSQEINLI